MKANLVRTIERLQRSFMAFTTGQKAMAVLGTAALLLAGVMVFRWASTPDYAPLYSNLSSSDASAVIDKLDSQGVAYEITNGGSTIMVPKKQVYATRISLSGEGLPSSSDGGYSILDNQDLSTSQFKEQTDFKRAMEGELAKTIQALDGVKTAVVHLALPQKQVFADKQDPATASVLVKTTPGTKVGPEQVQAIVNLVASSIDGLKPGAVTVADSTGRVLSAADGSGSGAASTQFQQVQDFQDRLDSRIQTMLDRVVGPGHATAQVTANLDFDKAVTENTRYFQTGPQTALSGSSDTETYSGPGGAAGSAGVVGPDGQMDTTTTTGGTAGASSYKKTSETSDNAVDKTVEQRDAAPGGVKSLHVGVVLDAKKAGVVDPTTIETLLVASIGIDPKRGDTVNVTSLPFDRSTEIAAAKELKAADAAASNAKRMAMLRNAALVLVIGLLVVMAWLRNRKKNQARIEATTYVVEQLRKDAVERAAVPVAAEPSPAMVALERADNQMTDTVRDEIASLVERQPEDVAALLRGWLVEQE